MPIRMRMARRTTQEAKNQPSAKAKHGARQKHFQIPDTQIAP